MTDKDFQDRLIHELKSMGIGQRKWHTDRGIPVAVLIVFLSQLIGAAWYGSSVASGVLENKNNIAMMKVDQLTRRDSALFEQMIKSNHELALETRREVKELRSEMQKQIKASYKLEKKIDVFIESQKRRSN